MVVLKDGCKFFDFYLFILNLRGLMATVVNRIWWNFI